MKLTRPFVALACLALAACGTLQDDRPYDELFAAARSLLTPGSADADTGSRIQVSRAMIDQLPGDVLLVETFEGQNRVLMVPAAVNRTRVTWISEDNVAIITENGLLKATRGLPRDLMAENVEDSRRTILNGGGQVQRIRETLSDLDQISTELLQCSIALEGTETISIVEKSFQTTRFSETCEGERSSFTNTYWQDTAGTIIRSRQFVSDETGYLVLERP